VLVLDAAGWMPLGCRPLAKDAACMMAAARAFPRSGVKRCAAGCVVWCAVVLYWRLPLGLPRSKDRERAAAAYIALCSRVLPGHESPAFLDRNPHENPFCTE
jgi:hypothetical protein